MSDNRPNGASLTGVHDGGWDPDRDAEVLAGIIATIEHTVRLDVDGCISCPLRSRYNLCTHPLTLDWAIPDYHDEHDDPETRPNWCRLDGTSVLLVARNPAKDCSTCRYSPGCAITRCAGHENDPAWCCGDWSAKP